MEPAPQPQRSRWHLHRRAARHVGRGAHHVLRWVGAFAAAIILIALFGIWRLMQGPIELNWLAPYVEAAIQHSGVGVKVAFSGVRLGIDRDTHRFDLRAENIRLSLPNGEPLARFPEMSTSLPMGALLHGQLVPEQVIVEGPVVHLVRQANGAISAQIGGDQAAPDLGPQTIEELAGPPARNAPLGLLHRISVRGATLIVDDKASGHTWRADRVDIAIDRSDKGARGDVSFAVPIGTSMPELHASYRYLAERQLLDLDLAIDGVQPTMIPPLIPELAQLSHVAAPVSGTLETRINLSRGVAQGSRLDLRLGKGVLHSDWLATRSVAIEKGELRATYAPETEQVKLDSMQLDLGGGTGLALDGVLSGVTPAMISAPPDARPPGELTGNFTARLTHVPTSRLGALWPNGLSPGGREWTQANVHDGLVDEIALQIALDIDPADHTAQLQNAQGTFRYHGLTVNYVDGLPPARKVDGTATFAGRDLVFTPTAGTVKGLKLTGGALRISDIGAHTEWLTVDLNAAGPLKDALDVIDSKPLYYAHDIGLDPVAVSGHTAAQLHFKLPLVAHLNFDQVEYGAKATITGASVRAIALNRSLSDGDLALDLGQTGAQLRGTARYDGVPAKLDAKLDFRPKGGPHAVFHVAMTLDAAAQQRLGFDIAPDRVSGPIGVDATYSAFAANRGEATALLDLRDATLLMPEAGWKKPPGQPGEAKVVLDLDNEKVTRIRQIRVSAAGLDGRMTAGLAADGGGVDNIEIQRLIVGDSDISGTVTARPGGGWQADIHAARADMRHLFNDATSAAPAPNSPPLALNVRIDRLVFGPQRDLRQVTAQLLRTDGVWRSGNIAGSYADGHHMSLQFGDGNDHLTFASNDLGDTLRLLGVVDNVVGGSVRVDGQLSQIGGERTLRAHVEGQNYVVNRTSVMAKLLALPSLTGFASALSGSGLPFFSLRGDIAYDGGRIDLQRVLAFGESLGITAKGSIDTDRDRVDLQGTVAPAYALNSLIGNVPIIGPLLGGGSQGLIAANYRLSGPSDSPQVMVNPLSALTPGFLREIFAPFVGFTPVAAQQPAPH